MRLTHEQGAGIEQSLDGSSRAGGNMIGVETRAVGRADSRGVEEILDRESPTGERPRPLINPVRQEFFGGTRPASTLVEVPRLAVPGAKVEIECVAVVP